MSSILDLGPELFMALSLAAASAAGEEASWHARPPRPPQTTPASVSAATDPRGPFRYGEQHWLAALKASGVAPAWAHRIFLTSTGLAYVPAATERRQILALRQDVVIAGQVAYLQTKSNAAVLRAELGRWPTVAELHAAHVLGAAGAARLVLGAATFPRHSAASILPEAARETPELFHRGGRALTLAEVLRALEPSGIEGAREDGLGTVPPAVRAGRSAGWSTVVVARH